MFGFSRISSNTTNLSAIPKGAKVLLVLILEKYPEQCLSRDNSVSVKNIFMVSEKDPEIIQPRNGRGILGRNLTLILEKTFFGFLK